MQKPSEHKTVVLFEDDGPGIPKNELNKVFEAYYRGDQQEIRNASGMGLGLTIAAEIIGSHGGSISLENMQPRGLRVSVVLPMKTYPEVKVV